jgi:hypothetical protein
LFNVLGLTRGIDFTWNDDSGIAVQDPSATFGGPGTLAMRRDLMTRLTDAGLALFWTVLTRYELTPGGFWPLHDDDGPWVSASASYILADSQVEQVHAIATRRGPGLEAERKIKWEPRKSEEQAIGLAGMAGSARDRLRAQGDPQSR